MLIFIYVCLLVLQLLIVAYDSIYPIKKATSEVLINVQRTPAAFEFSQTMYAVKIPEITPAGTIILQVFPANANVSYEN